MLATSLALIGAGAGEPPARHTIVTSDGVTLSVLEAGREHARGDRITVACIPGWSMPASVWRRQLDVLGQRYNVLALDPRGQGESDVPRAGYTVERRATDLHEFLRPLANVVLIGWSLGALEALQYVDMFGPDRLAGLVLVDSSVGEPPVPPSSDGFKRRLREHRDEALDEFVRAIFRTPPPPAEIDVLLRSARRMPLDDSLALLSYPFDRSHWRRIAHAFDRPLLYVVTDQFEQQAHNLRKSRPRTQIEIFKGAGHALFVDEAQRFNALIVRFADGLARPRGAP
jgi:microsomal epoxide hydrolase